MNELYAAIEIDTLRKQVKYWRVRALVEEYVNEINTTGIRYGMKNIDSYYAYRKWGKKWGIRLKKIKSPEIFEKYNQIID